MIFGRVAGNQTNVRLDWMQQRSFEAWKEAGMLPEVPGEEMRGCFAASRAEWWRGRRELNF